VARATRPDETVIAAPIAELAARLAAAKLHGPMIVLFGDVFAASAVESAGQAAPPQALGV
jgi:precorrin-4 methylase